MVRISQAIAVTSVLLGSVLAHPGHDISEEVKERNAYMSSLRTRDLSHCADSLKKRGHAKRFASRRAEKAQRLRKERGLTNGKIYVPELKQQVLNVSIGHYLRARDLDTVVATDHHSNRSYVGPWTAESVVFGPVSDSILWPDTTQGPYCKGISITTKGYANISQTLMANLFAAISLKTKRVLIPSLTSK